MTTRKPRKMPKNQRAYPKKGKPRLTQSNPEIGQLLFGQAPAYCAGLPDWVESMFDGIIREFERVWWNTKQMPWDRRSDDGELGRVHVRYYRYDELPDGEAGEDNFWLEGHDQRIRWYKYPGRGMSCCKDLDTNGWIDWHDDVMRELRRFDDADRARRCSQAETEVKP